MVVMVVEELYRYVAPSLQGMLLDLRDWIIDEIDAYTWLYILTEHYSQDTVTAVIKMVRRLKNGFATYLAMDFYMLSK